MAIASLDDSRLAEVVSGHVDADPAALSFRRIPTGKFNTSYFVEGGPKPMVLRIAPPDDPSRMLFYEHRMMRQEPGIHALVQSRTDIPVPTILAHGLLDPRLGRDYVLMERLLGSPVSDISISRRAFDALLREVGRCLRQAHAITIDRYGYAGEHRPMEPQPDWASAFRVMWTKLVDDTERSGGYSAEDAARMKRLLDRFMWVFERPVAASLLHMDVWAQNILTVGGELTGLVDWDRALYGDPEIEFAVLDYCGISRPAFWEGYGAERLADREAEVRRVFYFVYEVQKYILIRKVRGGSDSSAESYRAQSFEMAAQLEAMS